MKSKELIQKYLEQGLSEDERFLLEKRAMDDEFLDTSWEGLQLHQTSDTKKVVPNLAHRLSQAQKKSVGRVVMFKKYWPMAIAASVSLLVAANFLFSPTSVVDEFDNTIALEETAFDDGIAPQITLDENEIVVTENKSTTPTRITTAKQRSTPLLLTKKQEVNSPEEIQIANEERQDLKTKTQTVAPSEDQEKEVIAVIVEDQVIKDDQKVPATIKLGNKTSDQVEIIAFNEVPDRVQGEAIAYNSKIPLTAKNSIGADRPIPLDQNYKPKSIEEISAFAPSLKMARRISQDSLLSAPAAGWAAFNNYLQENTTLTKDVLFMRNIKPPFNVHLSFKLDVKNHPSDIKVLSPLSNSKFINNEAIRLLKEGGPWEHPDNKKAIRYEMKIPTK